MVAFLSDVTVPSACTTIVPPVAVAPDPLARLRNWLRSRTLPSALIVIVPVPARPAPSRRAPIVMDVAAGAQRDVGADTRGRIDVLPVDSPLHFDRARRQRQRSGVGKECDLGQHQVPSRKIEHTRRHRDLDVIRGDARVAGTEVIR
jgi:hypothetical protein